MSTEKRGYTMKTILTIIISLIIILISHSLHGVTHYVDVNNGSPSAPYTSWATAANTIQDAVDAATGGDNVLVTDGVYSVGTRVTPGYSLSNRLVITKNITVESVNGPEATVILELDTIPTLSLQSLLARTRHWLFVPNMPLPMPSQIHTPQSF